MRQLARSWLWFRRGLRRELRLPLAALTIAATATGAIALFSAQLGETVTHTADAALGADLVVLAHTPLPHPLAGLAAQYRLAHSRSVNFPTVAVSGQRLKLASVRAVTAPYPLRGEVTIRKRLREPPHVAQGVPPPGVVWIGEGLAAALHQQVGGTLELGHKRFRIGAIVVRAPGAEIDLASIAPVLLMNTADLAATGLAGAQSRLRYELLLAGSPTALSRFRRAAKPLLPADARFRDIDSTSSRIRGPLDTTRDFLRLAVLATVLIAVAALIQSARQYTATQRRSAAILKTLGAGRARVRALYAGEALWLMIAASLLGGTLGWGIAQGLAKLARAWFKLPLAAAPLLPLWITPATALALTAGLWLAPVFALPAARPVAALRGLGAMTRHRILEILAGIVSVSGLLLWRGTADVRLTLWTLAATAALILILAGIGFLLARVMSAVPPGFRPAWRYGAALLARRRIRSLTELVAFGLVLTVVLLLTSVRHDLIATWRAGLPKDAPDHFIINIQPDQREAVRRLLADKLERAPRLYPMVRARLTAIDSTPVSKWLEKVHGGRAHALLEREQTLSTRSKLGTGNRIVAGHWWLPGDDGKALVSVDAHWARDLAVGLGDTLQLSVAGRSLKLKIASLRHIHWQSFEPNFFLVVPPGTLQGYPASWITAMHVGNNVDVSLALLHRFPNLTIVNVSTIIAAVTELLRHATEALTAMFGLAFAAAIVVLLTAIETGRAQRAREVALLRVLGARRRQLAAALAAEFGLLGTIAGTTAGLVAASAGLALGHWVLNLNAGFDGWVVLYGALAGGIAVGGIGFGATLWLTRVPPQWALRAAASEAE